MKSLKSIQRFLFLSILLIFATACKDDLPIITDLSSSQYTLLTQDSTEVIFPQFVKGKLVVMGFIFTNCPDICPLTTNNMRLIKEKLAQEKITNVEFVSLSFDPIVDRPSVLRKFAELRNLDLSNWTFLTGDKPEIDSLIKKSGVFAVPGDTSRTATGREIIFYIHTDRIAFIDEQGRIRKNYFGSKINIDEIVNDIRNF